MPTMEQVLNDWYQRVKVTQVAHYKSADHFKGLNNRLGIPAALLSTLVGTTVFASLQSQPGLGWQITVGAASVIAAILTSLQTLLGYSEKAEKHRIAGAKYGAIGRDLEVLRASLSNVSQDEITKIKDRLATLAEESPNNSVAIYVKAGGSKLEG